MSLLMDALKKAELAKRKAAAGNAPPAAPREASSQSLSLSPIEEGSAEQVPAEEPAQAGRTASPPLPSLPDRMELLDREFSFNAEEESGYRGEPAVSSYSVPDEAMPAPRDTEGRRTPTEPESDVADREAIQNLFETKQPRSSRKAFIIVVGATTSIAVAAIGAYFWYQLQPKTGIFAGAPADSRQPTPAVPLTSNEPAAPQPAILAPAADNESETDAEPVPVRKTVETPPDAVTPGSAAKKLFQVNKAPVQKIDPALERGYAALNRGDIATARAAYEQALVNDPRNVDALGGLAVIAENSGNVEQAADLYQRMLDADPQHAFALAGLIGLQARMNPSAAEMRLKQAISAQPDAPALNFALGNLYAAAKRWSEAQQAYFKAVAADPGNPDYLFNLAVSLDQMRQTKLAANYYAEAIAAAANRPANFDRSKASERIQQLQQ